DPLGESDFRQALAKHFAKDGIAIAASDLIISSGCMDSVKLALSATTNKGDLVLVPSPCFNGHLRLLSHLGLSVLEVPIANDGLDIEYILEAMASGDIKACLLSAAFQNPVGYSLSPSDKVRLARAASDYNCPIIEDDVFGECSHIKNRPVPIKSYDKEGAVLWCGSFSKTLSAGYRVGWLAAGRYRDSIANDIINMSQFVSVPMQLGLADFLNSGAYRRHLNKFRTELQVNVNKMYNYLCATIGHNCKINKSSGGYAFWIELPESVDSLALFKKASENNISLLPGYMFSSSDKFASYIRLNSGNEWSARLELAVQKLATYIDMLAAKKS
ncbi:MAG: PLP-dependent aminotransferase family protein, partial [Alphaproteobacteria bacterium]|nr:PLP-dependent aminotransferase family protein [Alphaproteobacteria bacterium]